MGRYRKFIPVAVSLLAVLLLSIVLGTGYFGAVHRQSKISVGAFLAGSHLWISLIAALAGGILVGCLKMSPGKRIAVSTVILLLFVMMPKLFPVRCIYTAPMPLCMLLKPIVFLGQGVTLYPVKFTVTLYAALLFTILGNKLFCGWACPVGLAQEIVYNLPFKRKKKMVPFKIANSIRVGLFVLLLALLLAVGINIYFNYLNPFGPFRWQWRFDILMAAGLGVLALTLVLSFFFYRPYCYFICPFGLISWFFERVSIFRVRFNPDACTGCMDCVTETGCPAVEPIMEQKVFIPDCFSCGACIEKCPTGALRYGLNVIKKEAGK